MLPTIHTYSPLMTNLLSHFPYATNILFSTHPS